jgi:uncharacterized protein YbaP (TraB family)
MRIFLLLALALALPLAAQAQCQGKDLITGLPPAESAALRDATDAQPFARGNAWRASKDGRELIIVGTLHLDDPRHATTMAAMEPHLATAALLLVEAGPEEELLLKARLGKEPSLLINTEGPTLPEVLTPAQWESLSAAMVARGVPSFMAAKLKPWYLSMLLSLPPCATLADMPEGLDQRLIGRAKARGLPIQALEPYDTAFKAFETGTPQEQIEMLIAALGTEAKSEDLTATMVTSYFNEDAWLSWEFTKYWSQTQPGYDPLASEAEFRLVEDILMNARNEAWIPVIESASATQDGPVLVAFGALHLAGERGVLRLLENQGYAIERIDFK